jgi:DNA-directed RNA polymerase specialized sigma subunit
MRRINDVRIEMKKLERQLENCKAVTYDNVGYTENTRNNEEERVFNILEKIEQEKKREKAFSYHIQEYEVFRSSLRDNGQKVLELLVKHKMSKISIARSLCISRSHLYSLIDEIKSVYNNNQRT